MPVHPTILYVLRTAKQQSRRAYLLLPVACYLILLILYPKLQLELFNSQILECSEKTSKTALVELDETVFYHVYNVIRGSEIVALLCFLAVPYLFHFGSPAVYLLYLLFKKPGWRYFWLYGLSLGLTSVFSILLEYSFPTAPPWVFAHLPAEAKFCLVDDILPVPVFHNIYGLNKLVCGAFPSIHVQWPTVIALNGLVHPIFGVLYVLWISSAAIYSEHHWISDVLIGLIIATVATTVAKLICKRMTFDEPKDPQLAEGELVVMSAAAFHVPSEV